MDEIHVKPDISYKGGKIIGPNKCPDVLRKLFSLSWSRVFRKNGLALSVYCNVHLHLQRRYLPLSNLVFEMLRLVAYYVRSFQRTITHLT